MSDSAYLTRAREFLGPHCAKHLVDELASLLTQVRNETIEEAAKALPTNWVDDLLSGPRGVKIPAGCPDVERLIHGLAFRIRSLKSQPPAIEGCAKHDS